MPLRLVGEPRNLSCEKAVSHGMISGLSARFENRFLRGQSLNCFFPIKPVFRGPFHIRNSRQAGLVRHNLRDGQFIFAVLTKIRPESCYELVVTEAIFFGEPGYNQRGDRFAGREDAKQSIVLNRRIFLAVTPTAFQVEQGFPVFHQTELRANLICFCKIGFKGVDCRLQPINGKYIKRRFGHNSIFLLFRGAVSTSASCLSTSGSSPVSSFWAADMTSNMEPTENSKALRGDKPRRLRAK